MRERDADCAAVHAQPAPGLGKRDAANVTVELIGEDYEVGRTRTRRELIEVCSEEGTRGRVSERRIRDRSGDTDVAAPHALHDAFVAIAHHVPVRMSARARDQQYEQGGAHAP